MTDKEKAKLKDLILENLPDKGAIEAFKLSKNININVQKVRSLLGELEADNKIIIRRADSKDGAERHIRRHPDFYFEKDYYLNQLLKKESERELSKAPTIQNSGNFVFGDNSGNLNQSSDNSENKRIIETTNNNTAQTKRKMSAIEWAGVILGIIVSIIVIYQFISGE